MITTTDTATIGKGFTIAWEVADAVDVLIAVRERIANAPGEVPRKVPAPQLKAELDHVIRLFDLNLQDKVTEL